MVFWDRCKRIVEESWRQNPASGDNLPHVWFMMMMMMMMKQRQVSQFKVREWNATQFFLPFFLRGPFATVFNHAETKTDYWR
jgi:hypothetical protein